MKQQEKCLNTAEAVDNVIKNVIAGDKDNACLNTAEAVDNVIVNKLV